MLFDILKSLFSWTDVLTRKRPVSELDCEYINEYITPMKKHCCNKYNVINNGGDIINLEDDDEDDVIICDEKIFNKPINYRNSCSNSRKENSMYYKKSCTSNSYPTIKPGNFYGKHMLNSRKSNNSQSTLNKTHQLREKEQYGKLLQSYLPQRIQILHSKTDTRRPQKPIEVIEVESEPSVSSIKTPEVFSTPKTATPSRYYTPMGHIWSKPTSSRRQSSIEEIIKIDRDDKPTPRRTSIPSTSTSRSKSGKHIPTIVISSPNEVTTNTLRDKFSAKAVLNKDFIPRISEGYNERIQRKSREAEELKKTANVLSTRNRIAREVSLEQVLSRSMKLYEEILLEDEFVEEAVLPELTDSMLAEIKIALHPRPPDEVLVESFGLRVTRKDMHTLAGLNWLNDEVINFYMNLLIARGEIHDYPSVYAMNTFFYPKLLSSGHSALKRWTRKVDILSKELIAVPIHLGMHWCMAIIDFRDKSIRYYDSMGGENPKCLIALRKYLEDESMDKKKTKLDTSDWTLESMADIPQQMNGSDCGVFSCTFAEYICANKKLSFSQDNMPYFRNKMVYEILNVKIL